MNRNLALAAAALALAACTPDFEPASRIEKLRVLAVKAEPPEIAPLDDPDAAHTAALTSLVLRADFDAEPARTTTIVHVACVPTPGDPAPTPCAAFEALRDTTVLVGAAAQAACGGATTGIAFAGVEECGRSTCGPAFAAGSPLARAELALDPGFTFSTATPAERILGVQAVVLSFVIEAAPDQLLAAGLGSTACAEGDVAVGVARLWPSQEHVLATKRIVIRGPGAPDVPNVNPAIAGIEASGTELDPASATTVSGGTIFLSAVPGAGPEQYWELDAAGERIERKTEDWVYSWFSTAGEIDELHTRGTESDEWKVTGAPGGTPALVAAVVRDLRGGVGWIVREVRVAP